MTETPQIFILVILSVSQSQVCRNEKSEQKKMGVSVISVSRVDLASHLYLGWSQLDSWDASFNYILSYPDIDGKIIDDITAMFIPRNTSFSN